MTDLIIKKLRALLPEAAVGRKPVSRRGRAVVVRSHPVSTGGARRAERVTVTFLAPSFAEAKQMYLDARHALVSRGDLPSVGEGDEALTIRENDGEGTSGFVVRTGLYRVGAVFTATGY